jgi:hypothetical protein
VQGAIIVAQRCPRDLIRAQQMLGQSCRQMGLAERAFYAYPRQGKQVTGPTVHLLREAARCFGNIEYNITELARYGDRTDVLAWAWDKETNTRHSRIIIVPHERDKTEGAAVLTSLRDITQNNTNLGARQMREVIRAVLPPWFVQHAIDTCHETLARQQSDIPLMQRIAKAVERFEQLGVTREQIEAKYGKGLDRLSLVELTNLGVLYRSIEHGEVDVSEVFPEAPLALPPAAAGPVPVPPVEASPAAAADTSSEDQAEMSNPDEDASRAAAAGEPDTSNEGAKQEPLAEGGWPEVAQPGTGRRRPA